MRTPDRTITTNSPTAIYLTELLNSHPEIQQRDIAHQLGIGSSTNIMTLFKKGKTKFPIKYVVPLCDLLGEDPTEFINTALNEYSPEILPIIERLKGEIVDPEEKKLVNLFRRAKGSAAKLVAEERVEKLKREAAREKRPLKDIEIRAAKRGSVKLTDDPVQRSELTKVLQSLFVPA